MLWVGTPLHRVYMELRLANEDLDLVRRRALVLGAVAWVPLLVLTTFAGRTSSEVDVPFLRDVDVQARLLIALPLLVGAEVTVHRRLLPTVRQFVDRRIVTGTARASFEAAVNSATRISRSILGEILILAIVYSIGVFLGGHSSFAVYAGSTWYRQSSSGALTPAGWWYVLVSRPLFQFLLFRWYFRLLIWSRFLWQVSRLQLHLIPTHPDRSAGLGFLSVVTDAFAPFLFAHGTMVAGRIADGVLYEGMTLAQYELELILIPAAILLLVLGPELVFAPKLWVAKRQALLEYGALAERYVREFEDKWLRGERSDSGTEPLLGSADIQSLADLGNSLDVIQRMRPMPASRETILLLCLFTVLPLAPLPLVIIPVDELIDRLMKVLL
jgi:hypothetical protein